MINNRKLELPLSRTNFHGSKGVRVIEVSLILEVRNEENIKTGKDTVSKDNVTAVLLPKMTESYSGPRTRHQNYIDGLTKQFF